MSKLEKLDSVFAELLLNKNWVTHKTSSLRLLDRNVIEQSVSIGIDASEICKIVKSFGLSENTEINLPIALLPKGILFDFDISDSSGTRIRTEPVRASKALAHKAAKQYVSAKIGKFSEQVHLRIAEMILSEAANEAFTGSKVVDWTLDDDQKWLELAENRKFAHLLDQLTYTRPVVLRITPATTDLSVVKYRLAEPLSPQSDPSLWERLGIQAYPFAPGISTALLGQSNHFRVEAPEGMYLGSVAVVVEPFDTPRRYDELLRTVPERHKYGSRLAVDSAVVSLQDVIAGKYYLILSLVPRVGSFHIPVSLALLLTNIILLLFGIRIAAESPLGDKFPVLKSLFQVESLSNIDSIVTVLALIPSIVAMIIAVTGEKGLAKRLLTVPRLLVFVVVSLQLLLAVAIAIDLRSSMVSWLVAITLLISVVVNALLLRSVYHFLKIRSSVRNSGSPELHRWIVTLG